MCPASASRASECASSPARTSATMNAATTPNAASSQRRSCALATGCSWPCPWPCWWSCPTVPTVSPPGRERATLGVAGGALHADQGPLVELGQGGGAGVRAGRADAGADRVEEILHAGAGRVQELSSGGDALLEQCLAGALEGGLGAGPAGHGAGRRHAEAVLVQPAVRRDVQVARGLVGAGEPGAHHD